MKDAQAQLISDIAGFSLDPLACVRYCYPWGRGELSDSPGLRDWQATVLGVIGDHLRDPATRHQPCNIAVASGNGVGKLHPKSLVVETPSGCAEWGSLTEGDAVFGADGKPTTILERHDHGVQPIYRVTFDDGSSTLCGLDHLWTVRGRNERRKGTSTWRTITTEQILEIGITRRNGAAKTRQWEIPIQGPAQFEAREIDLHPYVMGLWLGDGTKAYPAWTKPHTEIVERVTSLGYDVHTGSDGKCQRIQGLSHLFRAGVFLLGSHERYIPDEYKFNTEQNRRELLRGLLDSDGEVHASGSIGYSSTSRQLANDVIWLVRSLGGKAQMQPAVKGGWYSDTNGDRVECRDCYRVTINLNWNPFTINHRRQAWKASEARYLTRWIDSIEYSHDEDSMCIAVDRPDGLYLANDFLVTHNTSLASLVIWWAMSTCEDCKIVVTANTLDQLRTKTWPEASKWFRLAINAHWFDFSATSLTSRQPKHERTWRTDILPWSENNAQAFAGLHNKGKRIVLILDEASEIADKIWEIAEMALTDEGTEIIWLALGNPTQNTGRFRECFGKFAHRWRRFQIDSRNVEGTNKAQIAKWIEDYGEDSDFCRIRIRGEFPRASWNQFIPSDAVEAARKYKAEGYGSLPKILSVDVARYGDDQTVIGWRQGRKVRICAKLRGLSTVEVAERTIEVIKSEKPNATVVDGDGLGAGSVDQLRHRGFKVFEFHGGMPASDGHKYFNRRAEVWGLMRDALATGMEIPDDPELAADLTGPKYGFSAKQQIQLEKKEDMKARGLASPDCGDFLAMTYSVTIAAPPPVKQPAMQAWQRSDQSWMA